ncbi:ABC transporter permease subunit [Roseomonas sp. NAR14]|uniref:ABC transporter permease subunit n=1 Tax=Roseomonas acroporae TaxID=2937791 RepID=A0A9X2BUX5_9PROT|nr:ABC transporter permease subunit [Roseomonas acroporae]MCK8783419.1 ABC transporter permease subunit [Roseomonas acroporae]
MKDGTADARPDGTALAARLAAQAAPVAVGLLVLLLWEGLVRALAVPPWILPGPVAIGTALVADWPLLGPSLLVTLRIALLSLLISAAAGAGLALLFAQSRWLERALFPYAVVLQVTPVVAIAPLILIWTDDVTASLLICATIVAFFPILANTATGLRSADRNLEDLFRLYGATRRQSLLLLRVPAALPWFLAGLRVAGGLALIGAVVAEFVAGAGGAGSGLAFRILEASFQLRIPRMFAALALISASGIAIFAALGLLQRLLLRRWHESELRRER